RDTVTITSVSGEAERAGPTQPILLRLQDGLQQLVPARSEAAPGDSGREVVVRFKEFETALSNPEEDFRPRGEDEREMTLLELWAASDSPPPHIDPWEIRS